MNAFRCVAVLLAFLPMRGYALQKAAPKTQTGETSKIPSGEAHFTPEQLKQYYLVYKNPDVLYLRTVFNAYLQGKKGHGEEFKLLGKWDKGYYRSKFIVMSREGNMFGGTNLLIMFQDRPDKVFRAWVYAQGEGGALTLRAFDVDTSFTAEDVKRMQIRYRVLLQDKTHAM